MNDWMDKEMLRRIEREQAIFATLDPALPDLTRIVMANDLRSAEDGLALVRSGQIEPETALVYAGSYSRISTLLTLLDEERITIDRALDLLPSVWPGSDPDDTDPRLWALWELAFIRNGGVVTDQGHDLPRRSYLTVWRGQRKDDRIGCAWSLRRDVAERFARGASFRTPVPDGVIIETKVPRGMILAYLTGRGEEEVIIDPTPLQRTGDET